MNDPAAFWARVDIPQAAWTVIPAHESCDHYANDGRTCLRCGATRDACWTWTGAQAGRPGQKYGQLRWRDGFVLAHRLAWELTRGPIPPGLVIDHRCRTHLCVNPDHLRVVTQRDNILAGTGVAARFASRTECMRGHPLDGKRGAHGRYCMTCERDRTRERWRQANGYYTRSAA